MTTAERIESTRQKIEKRKSIVAKNEDLLSRKQAKMERLIAKGMSMDDSEVHWLNDDIENIESHIAKDLDGTIPELEELLSKLEDKLSNETASHKKKLETLEPFAPFMEDLEDTWNEYDKERRDRIPRAIEVYRPIYKELRRELETDYRKGDEKMSFNQYRAKLEEIESDFNKGMETECGAGWEKIRYMRDSEIEDINSKAVMDIVLNFIARLESKVGDIEDLDKLSIGKKCLEGYVEGSNGTARVWSKWAGGYNVQRLHVRIYIR